MQFDTAILRRGLLAIVILFAVPTASQGASIYTQTAQGWYPDTRLNGQDWSTFSSMMTSSHSITEGLDFENPATLSTFDAVWVDGEYTLYPSSELSPAEIGSLRDFISAGNKAVLIGDNSSIDEWNISIMEVVGGSVLPGSIDGPVSPVSGHSILAGVSSIEFAFAGVMSSMGNPEILFNESAAAIYSVGSGEALVILDLNMFEDAYLSTADNAVFASNIVTWLETPLPVPEPSTALLFGFGLAGLAGAKRGARRSARLPVRDPPRAHT